MTSLHAPLCARNLLLILLLFATMLAPAYAGDAVEVEGADQTRPRRVRPLMACVKLGKQGTAAVLYWCLLLRTVL